MARNIADMGIIPIYSTERQITANALGSKHAFYSMGKKWLI